MVDYAILIASRHWPDLAERAIVSIRRFSDAPLVLIDDASPAAESIAGYERLRREHRLLGHRSERHLQHGLALDLALTFTDAPWVITCDHDVIVNEKRAFAILLEKVADDVGAVGSILGYSEFKTWIHPCWALWNADAIRNYNLSWRSFQISRKGGDPPTFCTAHFLCLQLQSIGVGHPSWAAPGAPLKLVPVKLGQVTTHAQVRERGDAWRDKVRL